LYFRITQAPVLEEIVFRGCMIPTLLAARWSPLTVIFTVPLFFGIAHIHHAIISIHNGTPAISAIAAGGTEI
jgi:prenyl protein peptidase